MRMRLTDKAIAEALRAGTQSAAGRKDALWRRVAAGKAVIDAEREGLDMRRKRNRLLALSGSAAAVALVTVFFSLTPEGTAMAGRLVRFFAPEKNIVTQIEGGTQTQNAQAMLKTFEVVRSDAVATATVAPGATATPEIKAGKLTWQSLALYGVTLDTAEDEAVTALSSAMGQPASDQHNEDVGGTTRTLQWANGTTAVIRNGKLYSLETKNPKAVMPNGLRVGLGLDDFTKALGEAHEAINGALAWGVGSNDNVIVTVEGGVVKTLRLTLVE